MTTEEFEEMKKHTTYGAVVLRIAEETISKHKIKSHLISYCIIQVLQRNEQLQHKRVTLKATLKTRV